MINREIRFFLINGFIGVTIAYLVYRLLMLISLDINFSSIISYFTAMLYGYFANKQLTFKNRDNISFTNITNYIGLHLCTLVIFVNLNSFLVVMLENYTLNLLIAFILPVSLTTILNFLGLRFWVFKKGLNIVKKQN
jgi:putative flippase GtrA